MLYKSFPIIKNWCPLAHGEIVAEAMDLSDYKVNFEALNVLRKVSSPDGFSGWIANYQTIANAMKNANVLANNVIPYTLLDDLDGIEFDYEKC